MENITEKKENGAQQTVIIQQAPEKSGNALGTAGFILALLALVFCWVPVLDWILWILGLVFSLIGVFKVPRGFAIAGLAISVFVLVLLILFFGALAAAIASI